MVCLFLMEAVDAKPASCSRVHNDLISQRNATRFTGMAAFVDEVVDAIQLPIPQKDPALFLMTSGEVLPGGRTRSCAMKGFATGVTLEVGLHECMTVLHFEMAFAEVHPLATAAGADKEGTEDVRPGHQLIPYLLMVQLAPGGLEWLRFEWCPPEGVVPEIICVGPEQKASCHDWDSQQKLAGGPMVVA